MSNKIDPAVLKATRALVIDDQSGMRSTMKGLLNALEVTRIHQAASAEEAVKLLSKEPVDLVLCDINLGAGTDGTQLLEHVRANKLVKPGVLWVMATAEADATRVKSTGDSEPDGYLVKPFSASELEKVLQRAIARRDALRGVYARQAVQDTAGALAAATAVANEGGPFTMEALRLKAALHLERGEFADAKATCGRALAVNDQIAWAELGLARALLAEGDVESARVAAEMALNRSQAFGPAYDFLIELHERQGDQERALAVAQQASESVPSARRQRRFATMAWRAGRLDEAARVMQKVVDGTKNSLTKRGADLGSLATVYVEAGNPQRAVGVLDENGKAFKGDVGFDALRLSVEVRANLALGNVQAAREHMESLTKLAKGAVALDSDTQLAVARAAFAAGSNDLGRELIEKVARSNHEDKAVLDMARKVMTDSGLGADAAEVIDAQAETVRTTLRTARDMFGQGKVTESMVVVDGIIQQLPNNVPALLDAAQLYVLALVRHGMDMGRAAKARDLLVRVEKLNPTHDRLLKLRAKLREIGSKASTPA